MGGGGEWRTCATRDDEARPVWTSLSLLITHQNLMRINLNFFGPGVVIMIEVSSERRVCVLLLQDLLVTVKVRTQ